MVLEVTSEVEQLEIQFRTLRHKPAPSGDVLGPWGGGVGVSGVCPGLQPETLKVDDYDIINQCLSVHDPPTRMTSHRDVKHSADGRRPQL